MTVTADGTPKKKPEFKSKFKVASRGFVAFPAWFIDELMPLGPHIPAYFWKFLLVLWRDINHHADDTCKKSMRQFHIRAEDASLCAAAVMVSGLFYVEYGWKHKLAEKGVPTKFTYLDGTFEQWQAFIEALEEQFVSDKKHGYKDSNGGYRAELLIRLLRIRHEKFGQPHTAEEKEYMTKLGNAGFVEVERDADNKPLFVARRLRTSRAGILSRDEKIEGAYPSMAQPEYDYETGKQIRMYRQRERSVAKLSLRRPGRTVPT